MGKYKIVIFPHIAIADETLCEKIRQFTANGGIAILSARSGTKDGNAHYRPMKAPGVFRSLAGCRVDWFTSVPEHTKQSVQMAGKAYAVDTYYELLETEGSETLGTYTSGFCNGKAAIVKNGNVYYIGFYCHNSPEIYYDIVCRHITAEAPIHEDLEEVVLGSYKIYLNHGDKAIALAGYDLLKQCRFEEIPPYGVALIRQA